jgi:Cellulase (glycosyl hydrolase family 5)
MSRPAEPAKSTPPSPCDTNNRQTRLGANVVRLHLQFARFIDAPGKPNQRNLERLSKVIDLAERLGLYLDITGLGTYRLADVPAWYRNANEREHWAMQAGFWEAVARVCANRPTVFAYNLMNEPLAEGSKQPPGQWTNSTALHGQTYIEYIDLDPANRKPPEIARAWIQQMVAAIRKHDQRHLITVGLIWVSIVNPEPLSGFPPKQIAPDLDFLAVHVYPDKGRINIALDSLRRYRVGKPVVVEETFPMNCSPAEWRGFLEGSRGLARGWLGQFWSLSPEDIEDRHDAVNERLRGQFEVLQSLNPNR